MEIVSNKEEMIFRFDYKEKPRYWLGMSRKKQDGSYEKGYINVSFKKGVELQNQTKIKIKKAWLDFYKKEKETMPTIFINDFEIVEEISIEQLTTKTESNIGQQIQIMPEDLPF